jgi:septal ring factor EnvC (AmiA/AmiB activator)
LVDENTKLKQLVITRDHAIADYESRLSILKQELESMKDLVLNRDQRENENLNVINKLNDECSNLRLVISNFETEKVGIMEQVARKSNLIEGIHKDKQAVELLLANTISHLNQQQQNHDTIVTSLKEEYEARIEAKDILLEELQDSLSLDKEKLVRSE